MSIDLLELVRRFRGTRVAVVGDSMLDSYLIGSTTRLTREAPAPVVDVIDCRDAPGGAANTAANVRALGGLPALMSVVGEDGEAARLATALAERHVSTEHLLRVAGRSTLCKQRVIAGPQMLARIDTGDTTAVAEPDAARLSGRLEYLLPRCDALIVSDYGYGVLTERLTEVLTRWRSVAPGILVVDARDAGRYRQARPSAVKPNYPEALRLLGKPADAHVPDRAEMIRSHGRRLCHVTGARAVAVTLDTDGAVIIEEDGTSHRTFAEPTLHARAAGAGDTFTAALALALAVGADPAAAAEIASAASRIVVRREGTTTCSADELRAALVNGTKIVDRQLAAAVVRARRSSGQRIVFTNGCFDIVHRGHVSYLGQAKELGDLLIVGLNTDASVRRLKGDGRPVNSLEDRAQVLAGLSAVDLIVPFDEDTPEELMRALRPDVVAKGGDYTREMLPEASLLESLGSELRFLPYVPEHSTTGLIERINRGVAVPTVTGGHA